MLLNLVSNHYLSLSMHKLSFLLFPIRLVHALLVRSSLLPQKPLQELGIDLKRPIVYILKKESLNDIAALAALCKKLDLPDPSIQANDKLPNMLFIESKQSLLSIESSDCLEKLQDLLQMHQLDPSLNVQLLPVSTFWGREPGSSQDNLFRTILDSLPHGIQKLFMLIFFGRRNYILLSEPVSLRIMSDKHGSDKKIAHKLIRVARSHFRQQHKTVVGPYLPQRSIFIKQLLKSERLKKIVMDEMKARHISEHEANTLVFNHLNEIAANYTDKSMRMFDHVLRWLWNKVYQGITIHGSDAVRKRAQDGHGIVYVPCHRSHIDYLLLSYIVYHQGMVPPHIAAGINLNFWPAGPVLRKGGAFFIRRSFSGDKLYTEVFKAYLDHLFNKGYAVEFFPEGGRSRTGRLLQPKTGMLAMTLQSVLRGLDRPVSLVPIYLGYDHVAEVATYHKELSGQKKKKESVWQVIKTLKNLKNYGQAYVNFGEPITLQKYLSQVNPSWKQSIGIPLQHKPKWLTQCVNELSTKIMCDINRAAAITSVSLTSLILLSTKQNTLEKPLFESQLDLYLSILPAWFYSNKMSMPTLTSGQIIQQALTLDKIRIIDDEFGQIISLNNPISMNYYRNNILHVFAVPALIAKIVLSGSQVHRQNILQQALQLLQILKTELFIEMHDDIVYLNQIIDSMITNKLIEIDADHKITPVSQHKTQLSILSRTIHEMMQRYSILFHVLRQHPAIERSALETRCQLLARRLGQLDGIHAPDFFDKKLYGSLIKRLQTLDNYQLEPQIAPTYDMLNVLLPESSIRSLAIA